MDRVEVRLSQDKTQTPAGKRDRIELELLLAGTFTPEEEQRLREIADRCPVHRALRGEIVIAHR